MANDQEDAWLNLSDAARRLGWPRERLRSLIRRDQQRAERRLETMRGNTGELLVRLTPELTAQVDHGRPPRPTAPASPQVDLLAETVPTELERQHAELLELRVTVARLEERLATKDQVLEEIRSDRDQLRDELRQSRARADRLEADLARPIWRRLLGL